VNYVQTVSLGKKQQTARDTIVCTSIVLLIDGFVKEICMETVDEILWNQREENIGQVT